ncbi:Membrane protein [Lysobacter dokdonensis DS-58]|uniref:Membrane protein n=1 Tax=Lysobacter dokdonensis DS-58 TaxID=1300345 RepID=A0A0A2WH43_9GAMM|nr:PH domain-containing protein [Lysobacter dokdonensis]KGQ18027.1 Membrane protein [Lysobacter dokdonensis DS-58]
MNEAVPMAYDWHPLPSRAKTLFLLGHAIAGAGMGVPFVVLGTLLGNAMDAASFGIGIGIALWICVFATSLVVGARRFRSIAWRLDDDGFAYRRGRLFFRETRVPASRVQHLDLKHGPLERRWKLATLVIHTAGSKMSAVSVSHIDADDAEALRDRLARQLDDDDAL